MRSLRILPIALALMGSALAATAQQPASPNEVVDKIVLQEHAVVQLLRQYSPLVETYIQYLRPGEQGVSVPNGDKYFLGRAELAKGVGREPLERTPSVKRKLFEEFFTTEFVPDGFLQMIYVDMYGFDRQHYKIEYLRREFLGEVRCLVFDVDPLPKSGKGRFVGRIWVEDQDYNIVRINGTYGEPSLVSSYFDFDSWRINVSKNLWLPAFIYSAAGSVNDKKTKDIGYKAFRAQTRLWGYNLGHARQEQELTKVLVESPTGVRDQSETPNDYSPLEAERSWDRRAADNVIDLLEQKGLLAPNGEVDKVLDTVVNNIKVTNNLDIEPEVQCRVLMTSTLESFALGHIIVLSRGLIDVLPNEATLAAILAHELSHIVLGHRMNAQFGFVDNLRFDDKDTFRHFDFARTPEEERAANQKANELLRNSPYKDSGRSAQLFLQVLKKRSKQIPNLITPNLGDKVPTDWTIAYATLPAESHEKATDNGMAALPLGARIKIDPWNSQLRMLKFKPEGAVAETEKMPFQITPFLLDLTRQQDNSSPRVPAAAAKGPAPVGPGLR